MRWCWDCSEVWKGLGKTKEEHSWKHFNINDCLWLVRLSQHHRWEEQNKRLSNSCPSTALQWARSVIGSPGIGIYPHCHGCTAHCIPLPRRMERAEGASRIWIRFWWSGHHVDVFPVFQTSLLKYPGIPSVLWNWVCFMDYKEMSGKGCVWVCQNKWDVRMGKNLSDLFFSFLFLFLYLFLASWVKVSWVPGWFHTHTIVKDDFKLWSSCLDLSSAGLQACTTTCFVHC